MLFGVLKTALTRVLVGLSGALRSVDTRAQHRPVTGHPEVQSLSVDFGQGLFLCPVKQIVLVHLHAIQNSYGKVTTAKQEYEKLSSVECVRKVEPSTGSTS